MKTHRMTAQLFLMLGLLIYGASLFAANDKSHSGESQNEKCDERSEQTSLTSTSNEHQTTRYEPEKKWHASHRPKHHKYKHREHHGCLGKQKYSLKITLDGTGSGRVSSAPAGIFCETDCAEDYASTTQVVLTAQPYSGSVFTGWSGGSCSGTAPCSLVIDEDTSVTAYFALLPPVAFNLVTPYVNESDMREITDFFNAQYGNIPWGRIHDGLDIYPNGDLKPFQAACSGRVQKIYKFDEQVTLLIACNSTYSIDYNFEAQAPNTGKIQFYNILVTEGQVVAQGDIIGYLYSAENPAKAHVHFTLYNNAVPNCPAPHFTQAAHDSILKLVAVAHQDVTMCLSGNETPPPLLTPYFNESDIEKITAGFSSEYSLSPWGYVHDGIDIYPQGDLKRFQAACSGVVDTVQLQQTNVDSHWQVEVAVACNDYVADPDNGGYFIPLTTKYVFETMSNSKAVVQNQLDNITVSLGQSVTEGDTIGYLKAVNENAHVHFALWQFGQSEFQVYSVTGIPLCPEAHFTPLAKDSVLNLLHVSWPSAGMCYQN
jgi:murein DD-endopeptidase MepM/ murein hydrolase activator NlpD